MEIKQTLEMIFIFNPYICGVLFIFEISQRQSQLHPENKKRNWP